MCWQIFRRCQVNHRRVVCPRSELQLALLIIEWKVTNINGANALKSNWIQPGMTSIVFYLYFVPVYISATTELTIFVNTIRTTVNCYKKQFLSKRSWENSYLRFFLRSNVLSYARIAKHYLTSSVIARHPPLEGHTGVGKEDYCVVLRTNYKVVPCDTFTSDLAYK